jgi:hypothetical protein
VAVTVGVDPDDGVNPALEHGHGGCSFRGRRQPTVAVLGGVTTRRQDCEESRPRADRLLHQASDDGGPGRCRQLEDRSAARHVWRRPARTGVTLVAGASLPAPRPGAAGSITARTTANARSTSSSSKADGSTCTWEPDATSRHADSRPQPWPRSTRPTQALLPLPASTPKYAGRSWRSGSGSGHAHHLAGAVESRCQRRHPDHGNSQDQGSDANNPGKDLAAHPELLG